MPGCTHQACAKEQKVWFPTHFHNDTAVERHSWCVHCGTVRNVSDDRPRKKGFWMSALSRVAYELSLAQCQKRLMSKEIEAHEYLDDTFGAFGSDQKEVFVEIVSRYCDPSNIDLDRIISL